MYGGKLLENMNKYTTELSRLNDSYCEKIAQRKDTLEGCDLLPMAFPYSKAPISAPASTLELAPVSAPAITPASTLKKRGRKKKEEQPQQVQPQRSELDIALNVFKMMAPMLQMQQPPTTLLQLPPPTTTTTTDNTLTPTLTSSLTSSPTSTVMSTPTPTPTSTATLSPSSPSLSLSSTPTSTLKNIPNAKKKIKGKKAAGKVKRENKVKEEGDPYKVSRKSYRK